MSTNEKKDTDLAVKTEQLAASERFTNMVLREFSGNVAGGLQITDYQRTLVQGYFIVIDRVLKESEEERLRKNEKNTDHEKYDNTLAYNWNTIDLPALAMDLVHYARMGLDMTQENMLFAIPFKNNKKNLYEINLMEGYNGKRFIAEKYALDKPIDVTAEVVYKNDTFKPLKKSRDNKIESYIFEVNDPFNRGEIVGAFAYLEFDNPAKNKLIVMNMHNIEKRKPKYASPNFWGGKGVEGWQDEMVRKTIIREAFSAKHLPRDPQKIDESYQYMKMREARYAEMEAQAEIDANANTVVIDTTPVPAELPPSTVVDVETGELVDENVSTPPTSVGPDF